MMHATICFSRRMVFGTSLARLGASLGSRVAHRAGRLQSPPNLTREGTVPVGPRTETRTERRCARTPTTNHRCVPGARARRVRAQLCLKPPGGGRMLRTPSPAVGGQPGLTGQRAVVPMRPWLLQSHSSYTVSEMQHVQQPPASDPHRHARCAMDDASRYWIELTAPHSRSRRLRLSAPSHYQRTFSSASHAEEHSLVAVRSLLRCVYSRTAEQVYDAALHPCRRCTSPALTTATSCRRATSCSPSSAPWAVWPSSPSSACLS